ncbi:MAG TPA: TetR/AcrR family transcriptional regulator [Clostridia bacterium]|nr:TetR/AcrR family transcriptional regulator [Clostridia bacterium]
MRSKHEGYEDVGAKIVATASELFTRTGVHGTSLNDIAAAASIAKGTVYYYYPAKEALALDVAQGCCDFVADALLNWVESISREAEPEAEMFVLIETLLGDERRRRLYAVLFAEGCLDDPAIARLLTSSLEKWKVMFEVGALKLRLPQARHIRARAGLFFTLLGGYAPKPHIAEQDLAEFASLIAQ